MARAPDKEVELPAPPREDVARASPPLQQGRGGLVTPSVVVLPVLPMLPVPIPNHWTRYIFSQRVHLGQVVAAEAAPFDFAMQVEFESPTFTQCG